MENGCKKIMKDIISIQNQMRIDGRCLPTIDEKAKNKAIYATRPAV